MTVTTTDPVVFHALATFPTSSTPDLSGVAFGIEFTPAFQLLDSGSCADFELPDAAWPSSGTGTALTWDEGQTEGTVEVYWFAGYSYSGEPAQFHLREHPTSGGVFADSSVPAVLDSITDFGQLGIETYGYSPVASETPIPGQSDDGIEICFVKNRPVVAPFSDPAASYPLEGIRTWDPALRDTLYSIGAVSMRKVFPTREPGDTLQLSVRDELVLVPDLSVYYRITTATPEDDSLHAVALANVGSAVRFTYHFSNPDAGAPQTIPNDEYFDAWGTTENDIQWHLKNDGYRSISYCGEAVAGMDVGIADLAEWLEYSETQSSVVIGLSDVGVWNDHDDYDVISEWDIPNDYHDYCGSHGTILAGLAGAVTNNHIGIASVCPNCPIFDIDIHDHVGDCEGESSGECQYFAQAIDEAIHRNLDFGEDGLNRKLGAISNATSCADAPSNISALYDAYARGIVPVIAGHYTRFADTRLEGIWPQCAPFLVTTGGYNWRGEFLDSGTSCNTETDSAVQAGPHALRISAPASGRSLSTQLASVNDGYSNTLMGTSGASAIVNGAIVLLQTIYSSDTLPPHSPRMLEAPLMIGMLTASALDYGSDPTLNPTRLCTTCERTDYGPGRINIEGAKILMDLWKMFPWEEYTDFWQLRTVDQASEGAVVSLVKSVLDANGNTWHVWRLRVPVDVSPYDTTPALPLPPYVAFPLQGPERESDPTYTNTFFSADGPGTAHEHLAIQLAQDGARGCYMTIDQEDGSALVEGYLYSRYVDNADQWLVPPEEARICYFEFQDPSTGGTEPLQAGNRISRASVRGTPGPGPFSIDLYLQRAQEVEVAIYAADGRLVRRLHDGTVERGMSSLAWDRLDERNRRVPVGAYFMQVKAEEFVHSPKLIVLSE